MKKLKRSAEGKSIDPSRYGPLPPPLYLHTHSPPLSHETPDEENTQLTPPPSGLLRLKNQRPKYHITHPSGKLANLDNVRLRLHYNAQPWVGLLTWNQDVDFFKWDALKGGVSRLFSFPAIKPKD